MTYVWIGLFGALLAFVVYITVSMIVVNHCVRRIGKTTEGMCAAAAEAAGVQREFAAVLRVNDAHCTVPTEHYVTDSFALCFALHTVNNQLALYLKSKPHAVKEEAAYQSSVTYRRYYDAFLRIARQREALYDRMEAYRKNIFLSAFAEAAMDKLPARSHKEKGKFGLGLMRLPLLPNGEVDLRQCMDMADCVIQNGFTYFDTAYFYLDGRSEGVAKRILCERYPRESFRLADKMPVSILKEKDDVARIFALQLDRTGAGYFDYYLLHALNNNTYEKQSKQFDVFEFVAQQKKNGTVRKMGFSFHDKPEVLDKILTEHPEVDFVQLQLNYYDWETNAVASRRCYEVARHHGKPIIVMEPVKGGNLAVLPPQIEEMIPELLEKDSPATLALRFAATKEEVVTVLSGMSTMEQTRENVACMRELTPLSKEAFDSLLKAASAMRKIPTYSCTSCRYCLEVCPRHLPIPTIIKGVNRRILGSKERIPEASLCIACGACEKRCPQKLPIRKIMQQAQEAK